MKMWNEKKIAKKKNKYKSQTHTKISRKKPNRKDEIFLLFSKEKLWESRSGEGETRWGKMMINSFQGKKKSDPR